MKRFKAVSPDPYLRKDEDAALAKLGHVNAIVDAVTTAEESIENLQDEELYSETSIIAARILAMGATPIVLLPAPGAGKYYEIKSLILEYTHNSTAYTLADDYLTTGGAEAIFFDSSLITTGASGVSIHRGGSYVDATEEVSYSARVTVNQSLTLSTYNNTDPTLGNGTLRAKIKYAIRTVGTEV